MRVLVPLITLLLSNSIFANNVEDMGEVAGEYYGACISLNHLKKGYCSAVTAPTMLSCQSDIEKVIPQKYVVELRKELPKIEKELSYELSSAISTGFIKTLSNFSGDKEKACLSFGTALMTIKHQKLDELRRVSRYVR